MKNLIAAAALILSAATASAGDLPSKKTAPVAPAIEAPTSWYVGLDAGQAVKLNRNVADNPSTFGGVVGYKWNNMFATEVTVDEQLKKGNQKAQTRVVANGVVSPFGAFYGFTPYALAGVGVQNHDFRDGVKDNNKTIYNVGGGVKYSINKNWEADARYRWVNTWSDGSAIKDNSVVTLGVNYKF
jgi:opacity protein-like surface antigen